MTKTGPPENQKHLPKVTFTYQEAPRPLNWCHTQTTSHQAPCRPRSLQRPGMVTGSRPQRARSRRHGSLTDQTPAQDGAGRGGLRPLSSRMRPSWLSGPGPHRWRGLHIPQIRAATSERGRWGEKVRERGQASHHLTSLKHGDRQKGQAEACRKLIYTRSGCCACARRAKLLGVVVHRRHREPDAPSVGSRPAPRLSGARLVPQRARDPALELGSTSAREAPEDAGSSDRVGFPRDVGKEVVGRLLRGRVQELSPPLA
jgi:hypothetical protein